MLLDQDDYTIAEVVKIAGVTTRTLRHWTATKVVPAPIFRAAKTRYPREVLARILAAKKLREEGLRLQAIKERLAGLSLDALLAMAQPAKAAPLANQKDGAIAGTPPEPLPSVPRAAAATAPPTPKSEAVFAAAAAAERWERIVLVPGLELFVSERGGPLIRRLANEIRANYSAGAPEVG